MLRYVMYFRFMDDVIFAHNGSLCTADVLVGTDSQSDGAASLGHWQRRLICLGGYARGPWLNQRAMPFPPCL